jgi:alpha-ketoglutarate-dependent taurine dioxygenase
MKSSLSERIRSVGRKAVRVASDDLIRTAPLAEGGALPLVVTPAVEGLEIAAWIAENTSFVRDRLLTHGGLLFRGFRPRAASDLQEIVTALSGETMSYTFRSTPRKEVSGRIYTSTEYPADQTIPMHNEMSYTSSWPLKVWFLCVEPAEKGGDTPIADSRKVLERIPADVRASFEEKGVMYVRNYGGGLDLDWQDVFQTSDRSEVAAFCRHAGIDFEWRGEDRLHTRQVRPATARHPEDGAEVWFNQAHLFHVSSLPAELRETMLAQFSASELPRNTFFGDGSSIEPEALDEVRRAYEHETIRFPWQRGDLLLVDNMLTAHGRTPFSGPRKIVVGMAERIEDGTALERRED